MREDAVEEGVKALRDAAGPTVATSSDFDDGAAEGETLAEAIVFADLAVALGDTPPGSDVQESQPAFVRRFEHAPGEPLAASMSPSPKERWCE